MGFYEAIAVRTPEYADEVVTVGNPLLPALVPFGAWVVVDD